VSDAVPLAKPRLAWIKRDGWYLMHGDVIFAMVKASHADVTHVHDWTGLLELRMPKSFADAARHLRSQFIAAGFDVDDVPEEITGGEG